MALKVICSPGTSSTGHGPTPSGVCASTPASCRLPIPLPGSRSPLRPRCPGILQFSDAKDKHQYPRYEEKDRCHDCRRIRGVFLQNSAHRTQYTYISSQTITVFDDTRECGTASFLAKGTLAAECYKALCMAGFRLLFRIFISRRIIPPLRWRNCKHELTSWRWRTLWFSRVSTLMRWN